MKEFKLIEKFFESLIENKNLLNLPENRLKIYQTLVFNNISQTCSSAFPITKKFIKDIWDDTIKEFMIKSKLDTKYLSDIPFIFFEYLERADFFENKHPFLRDLMKFELVEIQVFNEDFPANVCEFSFENRYFLSKTAKLMTFEYPVFNINKLTIDELINKKGEYHLLIYTNPESFDVEYMVLNEFLKNLIINLSKKAVSENISILKKKYNINRNIDNQVKEFLQRLINLKVIV